MTRRIAALVLGIAAGLVLGMAYMGGC